ncbi:hypothetical protein TK90_2793 (plasmid) [Thioalkalivibrio sp. K90mix]|uniref:hypothetical protein n=1 Tax=Thioalkalivibrio sp. (strain K90mix) TaxID=396595 RepID=UPI000195A718|nr:hypothetical protein [Thioalkalivibrio sp. K90mix]ADC73278.1 hypothetical protein TK90_2793 [Thioalkalivibrio sp. K90mix]
MKMFTFAAVIASFGLAAYITWGGVEGDVTAALAAGGELHRCVSDLEGHGDEIRSSLARQDLKPEAEANLSAINNEDLVFAACIALVEDAPIESVLSEDPPTSVE